MNLQNTKNKPIVIDRLISNTRGETLTQCILQKKVPTCRACRERTVLTNPSLVLQMSVKTFGIRNYILLSNVIKVCWSYADRVSYLAIDA
jgi:hypothetical protein